MASGFIQSVENGEHSHCPPSGAGASSAKTGRSALGIHGPSSDMSSEVLVRRLHIINDVKNLNESACKFIIGGPRYMREIGTPKICSHKMNSHIKKTNEHCKLEDRFQKKAIFQSHICKFADKKTAYNEGRLYLFERIFIRR